MYLSSQQAFAHALYKNDKRRKKKQVRQAQNVMLGWEKPLGDRCRDCCRLPFPTPIYALECQAIRTSDSVSTPTFEPPRSANMRVGGGGDSPVADIIVPADIVGK